MSRRKNILLVEIDSGVLRVIYAGRLSSGLLNILCIYEEKYEGYNNGRFIMPDEIAPIITDLISRVVKEHKASIKNIYIAIPQEFIVVVPYKSEIKYEKPVKIKSKHIDELKNKARANYINTRDYYPIEVMGIYYVINKQGRTSHPLGVITPSLELNSSVLLASRSALELLENIFSSLGFKNTIYFATQYALGKYYYDYPIKNNQEILIEIGQFSTSVTVYKGGGIVYIKSFSLGGGQLIKDIAEYYDIPYELAVELLSKLNLNNQSDLNNSIDIIYKGESINFKQGELIKIIDERLNIIIDLIYECMVGADELIEPNCNISATGSGCVVNGLLEVISTKLGISIAMLAPRAAPFDKMQHSSIISIIAYAASIQ